jgi:hypothetical protein
MTRGRVVDATAGLVAGRRHSVVSTAEYETVLKANTQPGPLNARMTAPIDGPNARAALNDAEFNVTALANSSLGTISVTIDCHDGSPKPEIVPAMPISATYIQGERTPVAHATASMTESTVAAACVHSNTERRE